MAPAQEKCSQMVFAKYTKPEPAFIEDRGTQKLQPSLTIFVQLVVNQESTNILFSGVVIAKMAMLCYKQTNQTTNK